MKKKEENKSLLNTWEQLLYIIYYIIYIYYRNRVSSATSFSSLIEIVYMLFSPYLSWNLISHQSSLYFKLVTLGITKKEKKNVELEKHFARNCLMILFTRIWLHKLTLKFSLIYSKIRGVHESDWFDFLPNL